MLTSHVESGAISSRPGSNGQIDIMTLDGSRTVLVVKLEPALVARELQ